MMGFLKRLLGHHEEPQREMTYEEKRKLIAEQRKAATRDVIRQTRIASGQVYANGAKRPSSRASEIEGIVNFL
ncbi:hypothetical protein [Rothia uropygioeca]|uniref:hypothetical protein n=1 Tax=Kocuria sp. 257 TaxID=2021970 RepID=UPI001011CAA0|nr:hypothetical protein [Kocuria sp. 257]